MIDTKSLPKSISRKIDEVTKALAHRPRLAEMFAHCFRNTLETTVEPLADGTTFVITGDIPAMWLRDSAAQVRPYLTLAAEDPAIAEMIEGVVRRQMIYIDHDPYANAFNKTANGACWDAGDLTETSDLIWERKYEVDSLCYPLQLAFLLWRATGRTAFFDETFRRAAEKIVELWKCEQRHETDSSYRFQRFDCPPIDTLPRQGRGSPVRETGMTWSGFRPSDDACTYGYLIPSNMFAVVALGYLEKVAADVLKNVSLAYSAQHLKRSIKRGLDLHATFEHPKYGSIYAYETDGFGNYNLMDDANVPSLLSLPYLGWCNAKDPTYRNTRRFILSADNPYFYRGSRAAGIGSPHTPPKYIWHIALIMQGLTAIDPKEREYVLDLLETTDTGTYLMHESFDADNPTIFTRPWFSWANSLFSELAIKSCDFAVPTH